MRKIPVLLVLLLAMQKNLNAQSYLAVPRFEAGLQFDFTYLNGVGDWGGGVGGRFDFNFNDHLALDSEILYRQHDLSTLVGTLPAPASVGQTTGLFGLRAGQRHEDVGFFVHARAGFLHFGSDNGATLLTRNTVPAFDIGGTLEHYSGPLILRFDVGEMIVPYGSAAVSIAPFQLPHARPSGSLGTRASPSVAIGMALRF